jgi:hypothetical protein
MIGTGHHCRTAPRLYIHDTLRIPPSTTSSTRVLSTTLVHVVSFARWHHRLSHLCGSHLSTLIKLGCFGHTSSDSRFHCKSSHLRKQILLILQVILILLDLLILFILAFEAQLLLFQRVVINIISFLLMIILIILGIIS